MLSEPFLAPISTSTGPTSSSAMPTHFAHVNGLRTSTQRISTATTAVLQFQMSEKVAGSILDNTITAQLSDTVYSAAGMAYLSPPPPTATLKPLTLAMERRCCAVLHILRSLLGYRHGAVGRLRPVWSPRCCWQLGNAVLACRHHAGVGCDTAAVHTETTMDTHRRLIPCLGLVKELPRGVVGVGGLSSSAPAMPQVSRPLSLCTCNIRWNNMRMRLTSITSAGDDNRVSPLCSETAAPPLGASEPTVSDCTSNSETPGVDQRRRTIAAATHSPPLDTSTASATTKPFAAHPPQHVSLRRK